MGLLLCEFCDIGKIFLMVTHEAYYTAPFLVSFNSIKLESIVVLFCIPGFMMKISKIHAWMCEDNN